MVPPPFQIKHKSVLIKDIKGSIDQKHVCVYVLCILRLVEFRCEFTVFGCILDL